MASSDLQSTMHPPATPVYVLRGHAAPVHALHFYNQNTRLVSGDADGWAIVWNMTTKRPVATWKAHEGSILNVKGVKFAADGGHLCDANEQAASDSSEMRVFTHGRDNALRVWRLNTKEEELLDKRLPIEENSTPKNMKEPWLIYSITVNALNFCGFSICFKPSLSYEPNLEGSCLEQVSSVDALPGSCMPKVSSEMFIAVPNAMNTGGIDIFHLPSQKRICIIYADKSVNTGMVMALEIFFSSAGDLYVVSGYEDGQAMVHMQRGPIVIEDMDDASTWNWERIYLHRAHQQPILSLDVSPMHKSHFFTSSADAMIVRHPLPLRSDDVKSGDQVPLRIVNTKHAGQQGLKIRSDEKILVTSGWDGRARVYSCKSIKELAVLKWHREGCYAIALAEIEADEPTTHLPTEPAEEKPESSTLIQRNQPRSLIAINQQRSRKAQLTHWIAVGSKDGKISLWDIY
ncbi:WD repeat protein [Coccidioides immitis RS]|uniref:ASTRA-associated protein 1 n=2 Tax=Coccidioides immitis TaxID=5501 RepID=A0A0E1RZE0_COCIM|nr:WD repeat protein [Coccidioides immitis RS]EAS35319.2 WD repeat protein [Coccidioides immitis RS]KMU75914.1 WD repeat containing protein [Coccidioides immitis RMSCC 3703]TPX26394.1 ASTRA complex subunit [Coccidioides immitis]